MNLTHANIYDAPHWNLLYTARHDLQLPSLKPNHWNQLVSRMAKDPQLLAKYRGYVFKNNAFYVELPLEQGLIYNLSFLTILRFAYMLKIRS